MEQVFAPASGQALSELAFPSAKARMHTAVCRVRCIEGEEKMTITLFHNSVERVMVRKQDEPVSSTIARMQKSLSTQTKKGVKLADPELPLLTDSEGIAVPPETSNRDSWTTGCMLAFGTASWCVSRNEPSITALQVKQPLFQGFGVQPVVSTEFADAVAFRWFRWCSGDASGAADDWQLVQDGEESYTPTADDVGMRLRVEAVPVLLKGNGEQPLIGSISAVDVAEAVQAAPDLSAYAERFQHIERDTASRAKNTLRVVSYNLLADNTPAARNGRYAFCAPAALDIHYRKQLLTWELRQYDGDVLCLQEVTPAAFHAYIAPQLRSAGWEAVYVDKNFTSGMGCAILYKASKFELCSEGRVDLHREWRGLDSEEFPSFASTWPEEAASPFTSVGLPEQLVKNLDGNSAVAQIVGLQPKASAFTPGLDPVFVVNTHLMGHPKEALGRVIQVSTIVRKLRAIMFERFRLQHAAVVFGGDFNCTPEEAAHRLMETGQLGRSDAVWVDAHRLFEEASASAQASFVQPSWDAPSSSGSAAAPPPGEGAEGGAGSEAAAATESKCDVRAEGVDIDLGWAFRRGAAHVRRTYFDPKCAADSDCAVDFVYVNRGLRAAPEWTPLPTFPASVLSAHTCIPSPQFGSDHIALVDEFEIGFVAVGS